MTNKPVVVKVDSPEWDTIDEMIEYFNVGISAAMVTLTRIMWEAGCAGEALKDEAKYGDSAVKQFAEGIHKGTSWVYECIAMHNTYTWEEIQDKFLKNGIPASSIARLGSISDEGTRNYVEDKLVAGDITYEDIGKAKKEYADVATNSNVSHDQIGDGAEPTIEESNATKGLDPDDPNSIANAKIRAHFGKLSKMADEQMILMEDTLVAYDNLTAISDKSLYEIAQDRIVETGTRLHKQRIYIDNILDTVKRLAPEEFEDA